MEIDRQVEPLLRESLTAVVKRNPERLAQALAAFPDDETAVTGARIAMAVALYVLQDQSGHPPTEDEIRTVARGIVASEDWTDVTEAEVTAALSSAVTGTRADSVMPLERVLILAYVIAGYLVSFYRRDDENWWDYLDRAEAAIETARG
jgi:hypothetical protein